MLPLGVDWKQKVSGLMSDHFADDEEILPYIWNSTPEGTTGVSVKIFAYGRVRSRFKLAVTANPTIAGLYKR